MPTSSARKRDLESAARQLFARHGYESTSMRAVAEAAGVSVGLAYNYFGGKEDLLRSVVETGIEQIRAALDRLDGPVPPEQRLRAFVHGSLDTVRSHRALWQVLYQLRQKPGALAATQDKIDAVTAAIHERLTALFEQLGSEVPTTDARLLFASIDGAAQHYARAPDDYPLDAVADRLIQRFQPV
jgi:AcrR family transcriptional regulator